MPVPTARKKKGKGKGKESREAAEVHDRGHEADEEDRQAHGLAAGGQDVLRHPAPLDGLGDERLVRRLQRAGAAVADLGDRRGRRAAERVVQQRFLVRRQPVGRGRRGGDQRPAPRPPAPTLLLDAQVAAHGEVQEGGRHRVGALAAGVQHGEQAGRDVRRRRRQPGLGERDGGRGVGAAHSALRPSSPGAPTGGAAAAHSAPDLVRPPGAPAGGTAGRVAAGTSRGAAGVDVQAAGVVPRPARRPPPSGARRTAWLAGRAVSGRPPNRARRARPARRRAAASRGRRAPAACRRRCPSGSRA